VHQLFTQHANRTEVIVASRFEESAVYNIIPSSAADTVVKKPVVQPAYIQGRLW
jgi:hypothetical protein